MSETIITESEDQDTFGGRLARAREASGLTIAELARNLGVTRKTLEGWETDALEPRSNRLANLAGILGVSASWLLQGIGSSPRGEVEADELKVLHAQIEHMEVVVSDLAQSIGQLKKSVAALTNARQ